MLRGRWIRASCLALALLTALAGCGATDSQAFWYSVTNGSERSVLVRFGWMGDIRVDPGRTGHAVSNFGIFEGPILVLDLNCRVIHTVEVTTQRGNLWLAPDGTATLEATEVDDRAHRLEGTGHCSGSG